MHVWNPKGEEGEEVVEVPLCPDSQHIFWQPAPLCCSAYKTGDGTCIITKALVLLPRNALENNASQAYAAHMVEVLIVT